MVPAPDFASLSLSAQSSFSSFIPSAQVCTDVSCFTNASHIPSSADQCGNTVEFLAIHPAKIDQRQASVDEKPEPARDDRIQKSKDVLEDNEYLLQLVSFLRGTLVDFASQVSDFPLKQRIHATGQYIAQNVQGSLSAFYGLQPVSLIPPAEVVLFAYNPAVECPLSSLHDHVLVCTAEKFTQEFLWPVFDPSRECPLTSLYDAQPVCLLDAHLVEIDQAVLMRLALPVGCLLTEIIVLIYIMVCVKRQIQADNMSLAMVSTETTMVRFYQAMTDINHEPVIGSLIVFGSKEESNFDDYIELDSPEEKVMTIEVPLATQIPLGACLMLNVMANLVVKLERVYQDHEWNATLIGQEISWSFSYEWADMNEADCTYEWADECSSNITEEWADDEVTVCVEAPAPAGEEVKVIAGGFSMPSLELSNASDDLNGVYDLIPVVVHPSAPVVDAPAAYLQVLFLLLQAKYERARNCSVTSMFEVDHRLSPFVSLSPMHLCSSLMIV